MVQKWETPSSRILYRRFLPGESLNKALEALAVSEGIREATIESCIGSLSQLKLRKLCEYVEGSHEFGLQTIEGHLELVSAESYIQPVPEGGLRVHIHVAAARPTGGMVGGHCEDETIVTGAFMYVHVIEDEPNS